jgi:mRNA interferase MazF
LDELLILSKGGILGLRAVVPFPFSDLTQAERRPALIISVVEGDDLILSQVTSQFVKDNYAISIEVKDFEEGGLKHIDASTHKRCNYPITY